MFKLKFLLLMLLVPMIGSFTANVAGAAGWHVPVDVTVNGEYIRMDETPFIDKDVTYVPIRFVCEALGADSVAWNAKENSAVIKTDGNTVVVPVGKNHAYVNGARVALSGVKLVSGRTFVPVRFAAQVTDSAVEWDGAYYIVGITKSGVKVPDSVIDKGHYNTDEILWLSRIIEAESKGEPMEGKIAVGNVILNRVMSPDYPDSIYGVIFDMENGVQFQPAVNGSISNQPSVSSVIAAKRALNGENHAGASLFFMNTRTASTSWIADNRPYYGTISNHSFYL